MPLDSQVSPINHGNERPRHVWPLEKLAVRRGDRVGRAGIKSSLKFEARGIALLAIRSEFNWSVELLLLLINGALPKASRRYFYI